MTLFDGSSNFPIASNFSSFLIKAFAIASNFSSFLIKAFQDHGELLWMLCSFLVAACSAIWFHTIKWKFFQQRQHRRPPLPPSPPALPIIGHLHLVGAMAHQSFHKISQRYGPIFLLYLGKMPTIVISSPALAKQFLIDHDHLFAHRPPSVFAEYVFYGSNGIALMARSARWRALRKLYVQQILSPKNVAAFQRIRDEEMSLLLQRLRKRCGSQVEIRGAVFGWIMNVMTRVLFSQRADEGELETFPAAFREVAALFGQPQVGDFIPYLRRFIDPGGLEKKLARAAKNIECMMESILSKRLEQVARSGEVPADVLTTLLQFEGILVSSSSDDDECDVKKNCKILWDKQDLAVHTRAVKAVMLELLIGGSDTTNSVVEWSMAELLQAPDALRRVQTELDTVLMRKAEGGSGQAKGAGGSATHLCDQQVDEALLVNDVPYLNAVMNEALRLHPPATTLLPRYTKEATEVGGYRIEENSTLVVNVWAIGRDEGVWKDAEKFKPERFLGEEEEDSGGGRGRGRVKLIPKANIYIFM